MFDFFRYFLIGFKSLLQYTIIRNAFIFIALAFVIIIFRRFSIASRSGGSVFRPYHISDGNFYIHNALYVFDRVISLNEMKSIDVNRFRGVNLNGRRYILTIKFKNGKSRSIFFGRNKANDELVRNLKQDTKRYNIKIHTCLFD